MKKFLKNYWYILIVIICIVCIFSISNYDAEAEEVVLENTVSEAVDNNCIKTTIYVDIKGEVKNPGVYEIDSDKRVIDVVNLAGGFTKDADTTILNLSMKLTDEMSIKIYSKKEIEDAKNNINEEPTIVEVIKEVEKIVEVEKECLCDNNDICIKEEIIKQEENNCEVNDNNLVNINTATKEELMTVTGIGESKAIKIIEYRENNRFEKIEDIMNVSGIGNAMFEKIKEYITV